MKGRFARALQGMLLLVALAPSLAAAADTAEASPAKKRAITFDDLLLDLKKDEPYKPELLTDKVKKLDGRQIKISGFILPGFQQSGIKQFVLTRDNRECCFGPGAALHDCILVELQGNVTTDYTVSPVSVEGKFSVKPIPGPGGKDIAIYHLDATTVK
ncbi:MAG TPA: DUF3299 domain-containing protein [Pirellulales bacterium]|nr:DUF3299 domain-containing protein [Pirellulales bacterium]